MHERQAVVSLRPDISSVDRSTVGLNDGGHFQHGARVCACVVSAHVYMRLQHAQRSHFCCARRSAPLCWGFA